MSSAREACVAFETDYVAAEAAAAEDATAAVIAACWAIMIFVILVDKVVVRMPLLTASTYS